MAYTHPDQDIALQFNIATARVTENHDPTNRSRASATSSSLC